MAGTRTTPNVRTTGHRTADLRAPADRPRTRFTAKLTTGHTFRARGFTLVELMITVAIVAILVSIALPSYSNVMLKLNRTAAANFMMDIANREEQITLDQRGYTATIGTGGLGLSATSDVATNYSFAVALTGNDCAGNSVSGPAYVITATAIGAQASDGNLCLDSRNNKTPAAKWAS
jgi:type IV pilus assembly protein PilE